jgi:predicted P-loop ATPase
MHTDPYGNKIENARASTVFMFTTRVDDYITNETLMHVNISKRVHGHTPTSVFDMLFLWEEIN